MLELAGNTGSLLLPEGAKASIDLVPPLRMDGIEDNYTIPFSVPVRGNEAALGHVHHLPLAGRQLTLPGWRIGHAGQHVAGGVLRVLGSNAQAVKLSFSSEGLVDRLKGVRLRDVIRGNTIDTAPHGGLAAHAKLVTMRDQPHESHCFPMHSNPALYGSENPAWASDAAQWDPAKNYAVNDRVYVEETAPVARRWEYQCIASSQGDEPQFHPEYWRRIVFGLVNSYDVEAQAYDVNTADGNFFAMVPWFRYDWLVRTALAGIGIAARGDWFARPETPYMLLANSTPLDGAGVPRSFAASHYVPTVIHAEAPNAVVPMPAELDSVSPNHDESNLWDPVAFTFTPDQPGLWEFGLFIECEFSSADKAAIWPVHADDGTPVLDHATGLPLVVASTTTATYHYDDMALSITVAAEDVGRPIAFRTGALVAGAAMASNDIYSCTVAGSYTPVPGVNTFRLQIDPADHVPDMELGEFLLAVADCFGLEVVPDLDHHAIELNSRENAIRAYTHAPDQGRRLAGPLELDHTRAVPGLRFAWPVDSTDSGTLVASTLAAVVDREDGLAGTAANNTHALVRSTRKLFQAETVHTDGGNIVVWRQKGYYIPAAVAGDADNAADMPVDIKPVMMDELWVDGRKLLMPAMDQAGESPYYATGPKEAALYLAVNGLQQQAAEDGASYPGAIAWGIDNMGRECESLLLAPQRDAPSMPDFWLRHHQAWADTLVASEPVTTDIQLDMPFLRGRAWHRIMPMQGQLYIADRLPLTLGSGGPQDLIAKGAFLRRLRPVVRPWPVPPAVTYRRCVYWVDVRAHFQPNISEDCAIISFVVDGVEHVPAGGVALNGPDNYVVVGGDDYFTNLIDGLAAMAVPGFSFWPTERLPMGGGAYHGQWMAITYPTTSSWLIEVDLAYVRYRYSAEGLSCWNPYSLEWTDPYDYNGAGPWMRLCENL